jgi:nitrate/nitrite transport system ATP-binding protein
MTANPKKFLDIWNLAKAFPGPLGDTPVVEGFNLTVGEGEIISLIGHSGCGKSTVLSIVAGLTNATEGTVIMAGKEVTEPGTDRGVVFQAPCLFHWMTAIENVLIGLEQALPKASAAERKEKAAYYLSRVGLGDALNKKPNELSAGMRQRVGLARAFALSPRMLLLDEPFGMLDSITRCELQDVLLQLWREDKKTLLLVTHDVDESVFLSDRVVMMTSGPRARVGEIMDVPLARPRDRHTVLDDPQFYELRERLIGFLEGQADHSATALPKASTPPPAVTRPVRKLSAA